MQQPDVHLVDDDDAIRTSMSFLLEMNDLAVRTYASGAEFLDVARSFREGCVVTDVRMPEMGGLDLLRRLRQIGVDLPVVVMTGHGDVQLAIEALHAGAVDFIEKPFEDEVMLRSIRTCLDAGEAAAARAAARRRFAEVLQILSVRETAVLRGLLSGQSAEDISQALQFSPMAVHVYRANVLSKANVQDVAELVRMALFAGYSPENG